MKKYLQLQKSCDSIKKKGDDSLKIGTKVKELAEGKGLNIRQLSEKAKVPYNTVYAIIKRESNQVDGEILKKLAEALDVSVGELVGLDKDMKALEVEINSRNIIKEMNEIQMFMDLAEKSGYTFIYEPPGYERCYQIKKNGEAIDAIVDDVFYRLVKRMSATANSVLEATAKALIEDELSNQK